MEKIMKEAIMKNIIILVMLGMFYFPINDYLLASNLANDKSSAGNIFVGTSIIAVIACFGCFAFTYEKINEKKTYQRYLAHFTTGVLVLAIGISLIFTSKLITIIMGHFILVDVTLVLVYLGCVGYDFWDVLRLENRN